MSRWCGICARNSLIALLKAMKIKWKSDDKNLTKLYPRKTEEDDEEDILDPGSFFNWFEHPNDPNDVSLWSQ